MLTTEFSIPISVEVSLSDILQGIFEIEGLLSYADESLTIEYRPKELLSRTARVETIHLSLDSLREMSFRRRVRGSTITLRANRLSTFEDLQIAKNAQIVLKVKRGDRKQAQALVSHLNRVMTFRNATDEPDPIPFHGSDIGLREIKGDMYLENDEYVVFEVQNALVGRFDTEREVIKVSPHALQEVRLAERRFQDRLYIRPKNRDLLDAMPGSYAVEVELKVRRAHRERVQRLMYEITRLSRRASE